MASTRYYNRKKEVVDEKANVIVAVATHEKGAEIICKALNFYFGDNYTRNQSVEMMHSHTSSALNDISNLLEKYEYTGEMAIDYLRELSEEFKAQSLVVAMRDELKFDKPNENDL